MLINIKFIFKGVIFNIVIMTNIIEEKTVQSSAFRILIEALKESLTDGYYSIDSNGIKIMAMDTTHSVLNLLILEAGDKLNKQTPTGNKIEMTAAVLQITRPSEVTTT